MAFDYSDISQVAADLIEEFGKDVTIRKLSTSPADAAKPWRGSESLPDTRVTVKAVFVNPQSTMELGVLESTLAPGGIKKGNQILLIAAQAATGTDILEFDQVLEGGKTYGIENIHLLAPGPVRLLYILEVSR